MVRKRVIVTGGSGFLGSFVVERLEQQEWCGDVLIPRSKEFDLRDRDQVVRMYDQLRPDIVIHLAATVGGIEANRNNPATFFYDNLLMGVQTMHYGYEYGLEKFVAVGTVCSYPKFAPVPFREDDFWLGYPEETNAPYGLAKKMMLVQAQAYRQQYGFNAIFLMPVNLYGPRDNFDLETSHVIPALFRKFLEAQDSGEAEPGSVTLWGDGSPTREFLYVEDCADAIVLATRAYSQPEPMNIGTGREISIRDLSTMIADLTGFKGDIHWDTNKPGGQPRRCLDTSRFERILGFKAGTSLEEGLRRTIQWYREIRNHVGPAIQPAQASGLD